jgi:hypothetical protein
VDGKKEHCFAGCMYAVFILHCWGLVKEWIVDRLARIKVSRVTSILFFMPQNESGLLACSLVLIVYKGLRV